MAIYRVNISWQLDSALPKDAVTINPHYFGDNPQALADAIKANILVQPGPPSTAFTIKVYDAQKAPPSYPLYQTTVGTGSTPTTVPRELALCLSYFSTNNRPSYRGRLYIPAAFLGGSPGLRPTAPQIQMCLDMKNMLANNLPSAHNWVVYSEKLKQSNGVSDVWVDDEWDIQRSRGLRGNSRQMAEVP